MERASLKGAMDSCRELAWPLRNKDNEHGLGNFLGVMGIAGLPEGDRIDEIDVPRNEAGKGRFGLVVNELAQQGTVVFWRHLQISVRRARKADN